jgi:excisionase family DNA binding protein
MRPVIAHTPFAGSAKTTLLFGQQKPGLLKITAAAAALGCSAVTVRRRVKDGSLPHIRIKGRLYFRREEIHAFIEAHRGNLLI